MPAVNQMRGCTESASAGFSSAPSFSSAAEAGRKRAFGETITVAGLVTAGDLIEQLRGRELGDQLLIPRVMLKADEPVFLDDLSVSDVERELSISVRASRNDGFEYLDAVMGIEI